MLGGGDLSKHLQTVGVHDGNAAEGGALLEGLKEERSGGREGSENNAYILPRTIPFSPFFFAAPSTL